MNNAFVQKFQSRIYAGETSTTKTTFEIKGKRGKQTLVCGTGISTDVSWNICGDKLFIKSRSSVSEMPISDRFLFNDKEMTITTTGYYSWNIDIYIIDLYEQILKE